MNQALLEQLKVSPQLPSLPAIAIQALAMARQENVNISEIADLISNDPALSSKILKTVNSSFYGLPKQVSTISHALVILGMQAVKTLALGFSLLTNLKGNPGDEFDYMQYWKRSIYSAVAGRLLARHLNIVQQEEVFLSALLADVGVLVMHRVIGKPFDDIMTESRGDEDRQLELCHKRFDLDHAAVGAMLAEQWQLPPVLAKPIAQHHAPNEPDPQLRPLVEVVYLAMICGQVFGGGNPASAIIKARTEASRLFKIPLDKFETLMIEIGKSTREVAALFEVSIDPRRSYQDILDEANQTLIQMTLQTQMQVQQIKKENANLQHAATTDGLTGVANRARFNEFLDEQFARAYKLQRPLALLFIDVDHFKKVNDTYGHQAGDEVLRRIGKLLKLAVRNIDLAARYGGEEFALVLTETESNAAAQMADEIRQAIQTEIFSYEDKTIPLTASIGVAGTDRLRIFGTAQQLTNAADRAVYAAKQAGRNCVRLFRPKLQDNPSSLGKTAAAPGK
jgi:diguanylate cyclase (GGDEF)-like protein